MRLNELFAALTGLEVFENRQADDNLIDVVFESQHTESWNARLESVLGPALKPAGAKPGAFARRVADDFGGVRIEQTLYYKGFEEHGVVVMFWPWQNGRCTTCKAFCVDKISETPARKPFWANWFGGK